VLARRALDLAEAVVAAPGPDGPDATAGPDLRVAGLRGGEQGLRLAGHLAEYAWLAAPDDPEVQQARHRVFTIRAERATSTMSSGVYRWAANESLGDPFPPQLDRENS
jgi:hypothetical protein